jgi:glutaredoxin
MSADQDLPVVELFTQEHCGSCKEVERYLRGKRVELVVHDVGRDADALQELVKQGYMSTPVIRVGGRWIAGFKKSQLDGLLKLAQSDRV